MNIAAAKAQIKDSVEAYLQTDEAGVYVIPLVHQRPMFLLGAPGIGKTAIMEQIAEECGIGIVSYSMTHHTRQSALGLPAIETKEFDGVSYEVSEYTMSEIVASVYDYIESTGCRQGILFLDEINCVSETLYPSMLQFLQFKTFGKHRLPEGWIVACAGNPPEYNRSVHEFDIVTLDRLREIDVEPDYASWKDYATMKGLHPAVTTFLETKKDCFYKVESKPGGGKSFVTARGWEDLATVIDLYEKMNKVVDRDLVVQFLRDDEIADAFSVYYTLFDKYRSDYQIDTILAGEASKSIINRAKAAEFDERVALMGLLLDSIANECASLLLHEGVVVELRDLLREAKPGMLAGDSVDKWIGSPVIRERRDELNRKMRLNIASDSYVRKESLVISKLAEILAECELAGVDAGEKAFETIQTAYKAMVTEFQTHTSSAGVHLDNTFDFIDEALDSREMLVFIAELATRKATTQYIAHYGSDSYYKHNKEMQVDSARSGLEDRINKLHELDENIKEAAEAGDMTGLGATGISLGGVCEVDKDTSIVQSALRDHYASKEFEYGFASVCKMLLPMSELKGKTVLDICCRRGRGVYKLGAMVGNEGTAWGVDWSESYIAEARDGMDRARSDSGLKRINTEFRVAYPEDLISAGIGTNTMDMVYVNNVMTLFYSQQAALEEFARVLKPGGLLVMETVISSEERPASVIDAAREIGNSIQAALTEEANFKMLEAAGFDTPRLEEEYEVEASRGYKAGETVETVPDSENVEYKAVCYYVTKK